MRRHLIAALLVALPSAISAQTHLPPGTRVRVMVREWPNPLATGPLIRETADTLVIGGAPAPIVLTPDRYLQVSAGRHPQTLRGMAIGLVGGAIVGAIVGGVAASAEPSHGCSGGWLCIDATGLYVAAGLFIGGGTGLVIGGIVGSSSPEQWQTVPRSGGPTVGGTRVRVGMSLAAF